jgi:hypothetical protein
MQKSSLLCDTRIMRNLQVLQGLDVVRSYVLGFISKFAILGLGVVGVAATPQTAQAGRARAARGGLNRVRAAHHGRRRGHTGGLSHDSSLQ